MPPHQGGKGGIVPVVNEQVQQFPIRLSGPVVLDRPPKVLDEPVRLVDRHQVISCERRPFLSLILGDGPIVRSF
jgi:hypothetical protein